MKRIIYIITLLALPLLSLGNDQVNTLFAKANEQYTKGRYKEAIQTYQSILNDGYQSASIYFNLGNAYYKQGEIPSAILYYEKAHKVAPGDADIQFNIQLANSKTTDKIEPAPEFFLTKWCDAFVLGFAINTWAVLSILLFVTGFGLLTVYLFAQSVGIKKAAFFASAGLIFLGLLTILLAANQSRYFAAHHQAIVFSTSVTVKSEPGPSAKNLFVIHNGTKVDILENNNSWMRIKLANGNEGWIAVTDVKNI